MGAFYLVCEPDPVERARLADVLDAAIQAQGFDAGQRIAQGCVVAGFHGKLAGAPAQVHVARDDRFAALCGTALLDGQVGVAAARRLLECAQEGTPNFSRLLGSFCALQGDRHKARLFLDPLGVYKVYTTPDLRLFCSSFLALGDVLGRLTPDPQGVYEYVHQEATYGGATVAREIRLAQSGGCYEFSHAARWVPWMDGWSPHPAQGDESAHLGGVLERLRTLYAQIALGFDGAVDTALSGGYDSRLTLALLLEQGVKPSIHVYGAADSADVTVARAVTEGEGLALEHADKSRWPSVSAEHYASVVEHNHRLFDGWPPAGIFDQGADRATRLERAAGGRLMLNGGGGEIFRNFFYLPERRFTPMEVVWSFYSRYAPQWCTGAFDEDAYLDALAGKLAASVGGGEVLSREQVEYVYPAFRCGFWMGRNSSINARLGWALTPFIDRDLVRLAVGIPMRLKQHGRFEARLIQSISPSLARYASDYGHSFDRPPPLRRILEGHATLMRPPRLRRYIYRLRHWRPGQRPASVQPEMLSRVIDPRMPVLSEYFHPERINDPAAYARVATLEYLFGERRSS